jgi:N-acylmannosamine kinase
MLAADPVQKRALPGRGALPSGLAVDFGGTKIAAARLLNGEILAQRLIKTEGNAPVASQIDAIIQLLHSLEVRQDDQIGIAVTGRVERTGLWHALNKTTLSQVQVVPLQEILSQHFDRMVHVVNDATAAVIGETLSGAGRGYMNVAYLTVSTGVGGGFIIEGKPLLSQSGLAGHAGFMTSRLARDRCGSGRMQTVESIASGRAIARYADDLGHTGMDARAVFEAHLRGENWATELIEQSARAIAETCTNLKCLLDPDIIVLGGSIGLAHGYLAMVQRYLEGEPEIFRPNIAAAALGIGGIFVGALALETGESP